jgi:ADP-ribose pyrophosphatase
MTFDYRVEESTVAFTGRIFTVRSDVVCMPDGGSSQRDVTELPGAVAIVAIDDEEQVVLVRQYRHPVRRRLWEVPAGLLDDPHESALEAGARELLEEAGLRAGRWHTLTDVLTTPGMSDETIRLLLARDLSPVGVQDRPTPTFEEADMEVAHVPLVSAVEQVFAGELENGITSTALLAAYVALREGRDLRPVDAPWPARKT